MDLLTYVASYKNCAINNVPTEVLDGWRKAYPELEMHFPDSHHHVRFLKGKYISYYDTPYKVGELFIGGELQYVIDYAEFVAIPEDDVALDDSFADLI